MLPSTPSCIFLLRWICLKDLYFHFQFEPCNIKWVGDSLRQGPSKAATQEFCAQRQSHFVPRAFGPSPREVLQQLCFKQFKEVEGKTGIWDDAKKSGCEPSVKPQSPLCSQYTAPCVQDPTVSSGLSHHLEGQSCPDGVQGKGGRDGGEPSKAASHELHCVSFSVQPAKTKGG